MKFNAPKPPFTRLLIANRGEIALRIARAAVELGIDSIALPGKSPADFLDIAAVLDFARAQGCDAVHPGYGFLSERGDFARACALAGVCFVGATPAQLDAFGDKARARALAAECGVPVLPGAVVADAAAARAFFAEYAASGIMLKAIHGGGGRGMRAIVDAAALPDAFARAQGEALAAFGQGALYAERLLPHARHIEVQIAGDGATVVVLGERDCTVQRRFQKLIEIAPAPTLSSTIRNALYAAAQRLGEAVAYQGLGTVEFLVNEQDPRLPYVFIEVNPRLQVEHTVTEEVLGIDLVQAQIRLAAGARLSELGLATTPPSRGMALQIRLQAETLDAQGAVWPASGAFTQVTWAGGRGVRVESSVCSGTAVEPQFDSLIAKLIVSIDGDSIEALLAKAERALDESTLAGVPTNLALQRATLAAMRAQGFAALHTRWLEDALPALLSGLSPSTMATPDDATTARAPMAATVVEISVQVGDVVRKGQALVVLEAMKMQHVIVANVAGRVLELAVRVGQVVQAGAVLTQLAPMGESTEATDAASALDLDTPRADLQRVLERHAFGLDANRPAAVAKRHATGKRTARENLHDLCELDLPTSSFIEYGALAIAAQTKRRTLDDLMRNTPADGMVTGIGTINAAAFGAERAQTVVLTYDYMVLAGTQGWRNHHKKDRMLKIAHAQRLPVVLFAEGGGGRPGDVDMPIVAGLNNHTFSQFAALSGKVPVIGIVAGRCFAGNAALLGVCDVIIATTDSNIGMGGPAMIEGGGLGQFPPEAIGPSGVQSRNGVIDVLVQDEAEAVRVARQYLGYFQGRLSATSEHADQRLLRHAIPENRLRAYQVRDVVQGLFDIASVLELRAQFGVGILTFLARVGGRPVGVLANNPLHLGGAIDADAADKAARFMQLCDAHGLPLIALVDTPGFMVGPQIEEQAQVRHVSRMFVVAAHLRVPYFSVVLRKGYGLGAQAMTAGGFDAPVFNIAWPTGEFGAMGLEGAVKLGFRKELEACATAEERSALYDKLVAQQYQNGHALNMAATLEIDAVIDPAETRAWLLRGLEASHQSASSGNVTAPGWRAERFIDTW